MDMMTASELDKYDDGFDDEEEEISEAENKVRFTISMLK